MTKNLLFTATELRLDEEKFRRLIASRFGINENIIDSYSMEFIGFSETKVGRDLGVNYEVHISIREEKA